GEDTHTDHNAGDLTDTTGEGHTAHNGSGDGVHFPALAVSSGTGAHHADTLQPGAEAVEDTGQDEGAHGDGEHGDTGHGSGLGVAAHGVQVLTKGGLVPDEPHDEDGSHSPQDDGGELADLGDDHAGNGGLNGAEGH